MKLMASLVGCVALLSTAVLANGVGVVDMQKVFRSAKTMQTMNAELEKQFLPQKEKLAKMNKDLQAEVLTYQKNQAVMTQEKREALQKSIAAHGDEIRKAQSTFQTEVAAAQNEKMGDFLESVKKSVSQIAEQKGLDNVFPSNVLLYFPEKQDITEEVIRRLK